MGIDSAKQHSVEVVGEKNRNDQQKQHDEIKMLGNVFGESVSQTLQAMNAQNKLENVAIFVDYDNVYWTLMNNFSHDPDNDEANKNLFLRLWERYGQNHVRSFRAYADYEAVKTNLTSLQKKRVQIRHVYSNDKEGDRRKNSSDIELCIDAIESTYKDKSISCYVFVTADSDMIPIISRLRYKGKRVELFYLSKAAPQHINMPSFADFSMDLLEFLNVEVKQYPIEDLILPSLAIIAEWETKFGSSDDRYLGAPWLKDQFVKRIGIPSNISSELIERLRIDELIFDGKKEVKGMGVKPSISLTKKGKQQLENIQDVAAATEIE